MSTEVELDDDGLPVNPTEQVIDPLGLRFLYIGPPGFGKTTTFNAFENSILLACEEGHKFVKGFKIVIDSWNTDGEYADEDGNLHCSFLSAVARLLNSKRFRFVTVDTLDALVKMCLDYHLEKYHVEHSADAGDWGKGWDITQNSPIRRVLGQILKTGRGIGLTTHTEITTKSFGKKKGKKEKQVTKKECSLPNGIVKLIYPQVDVIFHGKFGGTRDGNRYRDRIIVTEGSEDLLAKNRGGMFPRRFILEPDPNDVFKQLQRILVDPAYVLELERQYHEFYGGFDEFDEVDEDEETKDEEKPEKKPVAVENESREEEETDDDEGADDDEGEDEPEPEGRAVTTPTRIRPTAHKSRRRKAA